MQIFKNYTGTEQSRPEFQDLFVNLSRIPSVTNGDIETQAM